MHTTQHTPLAPLTTLELGGPARTVVRIDAPEDFDEFAASNDVREQVVLGSGSNVIVSDEGYDGTVALMRISGLEFRKDSERVLVAVHAGHSLEEFVNETVEHELSGVEMLTGIPGTVGATPIQNVGAYGQEVADRITEVHAYDWYRRRYVTIGPKGCRFGHRTSVFKHSNRWTILRVTFALTPSRLSCPLTYRAVAETAGVAKGQSAPLREAVAAVRDVRSKKGMILDPCDPDHRSVGSVFLSPIISADMAERLRGEGAPVNDFPDGTTRVSASWLIKASGFDLSERLGAGVRMSSKHFTLVAEDGATAQSFAEAAMLVAQRAQKVVGVQLTAEPDLIGALPTYQGLTKTAAHSSAYRVG